MMKCFPARQPQRLIGGEMTPERLTGLNSNIRQLSPSCIVSPTPHSYESVFSQRSTNTHEHLSVHPSVSGYFGQSRPARFVQKYHCHGNQRSSLPASFFFFYVFQCYLAEVIMDLGETNDAGSDSCRVAVRRGNGLMFHSFNGTEAFIILSGEKKNLTSY